MTVWRESDVPGQQGRTVLVTGANSGIGFHTARVLAERGARVVLACRDSERAAGAADRIAPRENVELLRLDLASLSAVREAAEEFRSRFDRLDLLINNAGVTGRRARTADGFEPQTGVNHLGHFALTGRLLDLMRDVPGSRVVTVSSIGHRFGDIADLHSARNAYARSKLANLLFTFELQRRLATDGAATIAVAAHPGGATTDIFRYSSAPFRIANLAVARLFGRSPAMGALPTLRAATDPDVAGGAYYGPGGLFEIAGYPRPVEAARRAHDREAQSHLWAESERLTGFVY